MSETVQQSSSIDAGLKASWKDLAEKSLKGIPLEKILNTATVEGVNFKGLYDASERNLDLYSFPQTFSPATMYDSGLIGLEEIVQEQAEGIQNTWLVVRGKNWKKNFPGNVNLSFLIQRTGEADLAEFAGIERAYVDTNRLKFDAFKSELERARKLGLGFAVNMSQVHNAGASVAQELSFGLNILSSLLSAGVEQEKIVLLVAVDSLFFMNIAKLRSLRYLAEEILIAHGKKPEIQIVSVSSLREQTLYDPWVNMLRNCASSMAAVLGGANSVAARSHDAVYSILTEEPCSAKARRSARHILNIVKEESRMDFVLDASKGSFAVESLTAELTAQAWESFLNWEEDGLTEHISDFSKSVEAIAKTRYEKARKRRTVITGVNEFANSEESLESLYQKPWRPVELASGYFPLRRVALEFEELRIAAESCEKKFKVALVYKGSLSALSARINFVKNVFETLGLETAEFEAGDILEDAYAQAHADKCNVLALIGKDDEYASWARSADSALFKNQFIAGNKNNFEFEDKDLFVDLFMGKNIYQDLKSILLNEGVEL